MTCAEYIIISQYIRERQPIMDEMKNILMFSSQRFIIDESGIKLVYDNETQNKIDVLNKHIELIANNYKSQYPELFKFI